MSSGARRAWAGLTESFPFGRVRFVLGPATVTGRAGGGANTGAKALYAERGEAG